MGKVTTTTRKESSSRMRERPFNNRDQSVDGGDGDNVTGNLQFLVLIIQRVKKNKTMPDLPPPALVREVFLPSRLKSSYSWEIPQSSKPLPALTKTFLLDPHPTWCSGSIPAGWPSPQPGPGSSVNAAAGCCLRGLTPSLHKHGFPSQRNLPIWFLSFTLKYEEYLEYFDAQALLSDAQTWFLFGLQCL